jgi:aminoglycoside phosphotransferase (APT) family kinase protein
VSARAPDDRELLQALREALAAAGAGEPVALTRRPSRYRSSFPLEQLDVALRDGRELRLAFKRLHRGALSRSARLAKPGFLLDPAREPAVYAAVLPAAPAGPPRCYGVCARGGGRWLFLEWVDGRELYQVGERALWVHAAEWLGDLHAALAPDLERHLARAPLLVHDARMQRRFIWRARRFAAEQGGSGRAARFLARLARRYSGVVDELRELPRTVVHGDFNAANVLVCGGPDDARMAPADWEPDDVRVAPVDWELAAAGPGLMDLAALVSGRWTQAEREQMVAAYAARPGVPRFSARQLDLARLALAVQWLGWAPPRWRPPREQRHDWLADAIMLSERLKI